MKLPHLSALVLSAALETGCTADTTENNYVPPPLLIEEESPVSSLIEEESPVSPLQQAEKIIPVRVVGKLQEPLLSFPDEGTSLDPKKAEKVRKVAEYVVTKHKQPGLIQYEDNSYGWTHFQQVEVVAKIRNDLYTITTTNFFRDLAVRYGGNDNLSLSIKPKNVGIDQIMFEDEGLDGNVDFMGNYGLGPFEKPIRLFDTSLPATTRYAPCDKRTSIDPQLEKKATADALYMTALTRIIRFYETKKGASTKHQ